MSGRTGRIPRRPHWPKVAAWGAASTVSLGLIQYMGQPYWLPAVPLTFAAGFGVMAMRALAVKAR